MIFARRGVWFWFVCAFLTLTALAGILRNSQPHHWSQWYMGDAQTMLAVRHWQQDGFRSTHFLWVPQGYSSVAKLMDDPEMSHQAHGINIDIPERKWSMQKRIYTHFPSWYAVPYGALAKLGIYNKTFFQSLALLLSLAGVFFFFLFLKEHFGEAVGAIAVLAYIINPGFLGYCDSLATMPWVDCLRFLFLWRWGRYEKFPRAGELAFCFLIVFFGYLTSVDNNLFLPLWAAGYHFWFLRRRNLGPLLILAVAPVLAFSISFAQNVAYLGGDVALADWTHQFVRFTLTHQLDPRQPSWAQMAPAAVHEYLRQYYQMNFWGAGGLGILAVLISKKERRTVGIFAGLLFLAGIGLVFVFPSKISNMKYERQLLLPYFAFCLAQVSVGGVRWLWEYWQRSRRFAVVSGAAVIGFIAFCLAKPLALLSREIAPNMDYPAATIIPKSSIDFMEAVNADFPGDKVVLVLGIKTLPALYGWGSHAFQPDPLTEYYLGSTVLGVDDLTTFWHDANYLWTHREKDFRVLLVYADADAAPVRRFLEEKQTAFAPLPVQIKEFSRSALEVEFKGRDS